MKQEIYKKVRQNIEEFIIQEIDRRDDSYLTDNQSRIVEKFIEEICDETNPKMKNCTEKETEAYRKLMGIDSDGERQSYKQVCETLNKHNIRPLVFNANRKLMLTIYKEILFEDKVKLIQLDYQYKENKGMILPEDIEIENLKSIIYFEYEKLKKYGMNNVSDIINYTIPEIINIINNINKTTKRKQNKENVAKELIQAIHLLGFLFNGESGYEEQEEYFDKLKSIVNKEKTANINEHNDIKKELYHRKELIVYYNRLINEKNVLIKSLYEIEREIQKAKEEIIASENKIRVIKL